MNSRDAAFDENLKEILETTAAEAGATHDPTSIASTNANGHNDGEQEVISGPGTRKKRKRYEIRSAPKKRTRSASTASDNLGATLREETPKPIPLAPPSKSTARNKRGGRRVATVYDLVIPIEGEEGYLAPIPTTKRRGKANGARRGPASAGVAGSAQDRRNQAALANGLPQFHTSWGLPDYLAHLESILPSDVPPPLEVPSAIGEGTEVTLERGVKVKWPSKRMSVGDMNKRVRAIFEWVGREQASASERSRRKAALDKAAREEATRGSGVGTVSVNAEPAATESMTVDAAGPSEVSGQETKPEFDPEAAKTMKMMEELMEELISFQERFGPGSKGRERRS